jgi:sugar lactone lactonase YvrE
LATAIRYVIPNGGQYDSSNMALTADGSLWSASELEDVVAKLSPDGTTVQRWAFPTDAAPNSLLPDADGTFWVTELGGFNVAHLDPATNTLTEWPDIGRRPTGLIRRPDGKFWLPETGGALALFDPVASKFTYIRAAGTYSLSYPWMDPDGTLYVCDFLVPALYSFAPDGSSAKRWELPASSAPSKVIRAFDGALWITLYSSAQILRLDTTTNEAKVYQLPFADLPYDIKSYNRRLVFTEQRNNYVGFLDPSIDNPFQTVTVTPVDEPVLSTTSPSIAITSTLVTTTAAVPVPTPGAITGFVSGGLTYYSAGLGTNFALLVDEARGRLWLETGTTLTLLLPASSAASDRILPSAASIAGRFGARWTTQLVSWNRGLAKNTAGVPQPVPYVESLLPSRFIIGLSPSDPTSLAPGQLLSQPDAIGVSMAAPDTYGGIRLAASANPDELFAWGRTSYARADGGTYGAAQNLVTPDRSINAGESGVLFAPPDPSTQRTNVGVFVVDSAVGTISIVDSDGVARASQPFDFPAGYHTQLSPVFDAFGLPPLASARIVVAVTTGRVLAFGTSIDNVTNDPIALAVEKTPYVNASLLEVARGGGPLGTSVKTDVQLFNPGASDAHVTLVFHPSAAEGGAPAAPSAGTFTVPAGRVVTLGDVLGTLQAAPGTGYLELASSAAVDSFARVTAGAAGGGTFGYGVPPVTGADVVAPGSRGVFISVGQDAALRSDLELVNQTDVASTVALALFDAAGAAAGTKTVTVPPHTSLAIENVWTSAGGATTDLGRLDVVPADGSGAVLAVLLRQDRLTGDADPVLPFLMPR